MGLLHAARPRRKHAIRAWTPTGAIRISPFLRGARVPPAHARAQRPSRRRALRERRRDGIENASTSRADVREQSHLRGVTAGDDPQAPSERYVESLDQQPTTTATEYRSSGCAPTRKASRVGTSRGAGCSPFARRKNRRVRAREVARRHHRHADGRRRRRTPPGRANRATTCSTRSIRRRRSRSVERARLHWKHWQTKRSPCRRTSLDLAPSVEQQPLHW